MYILEKSRHNESLIMSDETHDEWEKIVDTTCRVVDDMNSRGKSFHSTLAKVLKIGAKYEVKHHIRLRSIKYAFLKFILGTINNQYLIYTFFL